MLATQKMRISMIRKLVILSSLILLLFANAIAIPPDTLDFGFMKFYKEQSHLYYDQVQGVAIRSENGQSIPSAVVFKDSIMFLTSSDKISKVDSIPPLLAIAVVPSQTGKYIYLFGPHNDRPGGIHELYDYTGTRLFTRDETARIGLSGFGIPLEKSRQFLLAQHGIITLTTFEGKKINDVTLQDTALYEDGDIVLSVTPNEKRIFAAVNKFKMPKPEVGPEFVAFDSKLRVISRRTLPYLLIINQQCSSDGKFILLRVELSDGTAPVIVCDSTGLELFRLNNPQIAKFTADSKYLFNVKRSAKASVLETAAWDSVYAPNITMTGFNWTDADISDDGNIMAFFDGNHLLMGNKGKQASGEMPFPYAFKTVKLYDYGKRMIFSGEFGAVVYRMVEE
jgi:hypothetical protein